MNFPPDERITPQPWLLAPRERDIRIVVIHSTRGQNTTDKQYVATKNWLLSRENYQTGGWGSSTNRIISHQGQMCVACPDDIQPTWSCGFGDSGSWAVDWYAVSFELAQSKPDEEFRRETLERAAIETAKLCHQYGIPAVWLDSVDQMAAVPSGITGHDRTDNGRKYGKTDPGGRFPVETFLSQVREHLAELGGPKKSGKVPAGLLAVHKVQPGENLWRIARLYYGDGSRWSVIYDANKPVIGPEPGLIKVGMRLKIPRL